MTSLLGGKRVPKYHIRIETYGTVDELISFIGYLKDSSIKEQYKDWLLQVQNILMVCAANLAGEDDQCKNKVPVLKKNEIDQLEKAIDVMEDELQPLKSFILPGGHTNSSLCHVCRSVCRRAERLILKLNEEVDVEENILVYFNRLSDFLFVLARKILYDAEIDDIKWSPEL